MAIDADSTVLQASLLFKEDFSLYVKWQLKRVTISRIGLIQDALEYHRFVQHREAPINRCLSSPSTSQLPSPPVSPLSWKSHIASECGHAYHPSDPIIVELCPVCEVTAHLSFLRAITIAWDKAGGPRLRPGPHRKGKSYNDIRAGWYMARLQLQQFLALLGIVYEYQQAWECKHPLAAAEAQRTNSASAALKLAMENSRYPARLISSPMSPKFGKLIPKSKKVIFASELLIKRNNSIFTSTIKDVRDRTRDTYLRLSKTYEPGDHACSPDSEFLDTSGTKTEPGDINNLKLFVTDDRDAFYSMQINERCLKGSHGKYQGLVGMNTLKKEIFVHIVDFMIDTYGGSWTKSNLEDLVSEADRMTVLIDEVAGQLIDIFLFDGSDEHKEDNILEKKGKAVASKDWTCLRECLSFPLPLD